MCLCLILTALKSPKHPIKKAKKNAFSHHIGLIAQKPTQHHTCQWSVNSSLYVTVISKNKLALFLPWFNFDRPLKSEYSHFKNLIFFIFQALDLIFDLDI